MKATLTFKLPEENPEFELAMKAPAYAGAIEAIYQEIFRPINKHGYGNKELDTLSESPQVREFMDLLQAKYHAISDYYNLK